MPFMYKKFHEKNKNDRQRYVMIKKIDHLYGSSAKLFFSHHLVTLYRDLACSLQLLFRYILVYVQELCVTALI